MKRFSGEQIIGFLREAESGLPIKQLCRRHGFSENSYYLWRAKFGDMDVADAKRLKELETKNARLKKLLAESVLEINQKHFERRYAEARLQLKRRKRKITTGFLNIFICYN